MAYNKAKEEYRWNQWKAEEEKILREQGVDEETIQKLREYDWDDFNAERRFREHQTSLLDCMELLLEEKETKESQPESVEALLDTEEYIFYVARAEFLLVEYFSAILFLVLLVHFPYK